MTSKYKAAPPEAPFKVEKVPTLRIEFGAEKFEITEVQGRMILQALAGALGVKLHNPDARTYEQGLIAGSDYIFNRAYTPTNGRFERKVRALLTPIRDEYHLKIKHGGASRYYL